MKQITDITDYGASNLASAIVTRAYEDYRRYAVSMAELLSERNEGLLIPAKKGRNRIDRIDRFWIIQKDLLGDRMTLFLDLVPIKLTPEELKDRFEREHPDIFRTLKEEELLLSETNRAEVQDRLFALRS